MRRRVSKEEDLLREALAMQFAGLAAPKRNGKSLKKKTASPKKKGRAAR
jgi:hypothetical protein